MTVIIALTTIYLLVLFSLRKIEMFLILAFFGIYYIIPPLSYYFLTHGGKWQTLNNEIIFDTYLGFSEKGIFILSSFSVIFILSTLYFDRKYTQKIHVFFKTDQSKAEKLAILFFLIFVLYIQRRGGFSVIYNVKWSEKFSNPTFLDIIILNLKIVLPFMFLTFCKKSRTNVFIAILMAISFVIEGSGRKYLLLFASLWYLKTRSENWSLKKDFLILSISVISFFLLAQFILLLRGGGFDLNEAKNSILFNSFKQLILASEPIGTYNISVKYINSEDGPIGWFLEFLKIPLFPLQKIGLINFPTVAYELGKWHNPTVDNLTLFPTLIVEGWYHLRYFGVIVYIGLYFFLIRILKLLFVKQGLFPIAVILFNVQMIRGYFTLCVGYLLVIYSVNLIMRLKYERKYNLFNL